MSKTSRGHLDGLAAAFRFARIPLACAALVALVTADPIGRTLAIAIGALVIVAGVALNARQIFIGRPAMRRLLSVAALLAVGATAADAQSSEYSNVASPASARWDEGLTGTYVLELAVPNRMNKVNLTISDSAGGLAANFQPVGDRDNHAMTVRVQDNDMILQAFTPRGLFEIVLKRQADVITGRWSLGTATGVVQGRVAENITKP